MKKNITLLLLLLPVGLSALESTSIPSTSTPSNPSSYTRFKEQVLTTLGLDKNLNLTTPEGQAQLKAKYEQLKNQLNSGMETLGLKNKTLPVAEEVKRPEETKTVGMEDEIGVVSHDLTQQTSPVKEQNTKSLMEKIGELYNYYVKPQASPYQIK